MTRRALIVFAAAFFCAAVRADRIETVLADWTCDGVRVDIPHTWNSVDGADGQGAYPLDTDNSVAGRGYLRTSKTYRTRLPFPRVEKRYFVKCGGAAVTAKVAVNGRLVGVHNFAQTGFVFEITPYLRQYGNTLEIAVDNYFDEDLPPIYGDYTVCGGIYRPVTLIETDQLCIDPARQGSDGFEVETEADGTVRIKTFLSGPAEGAEVTYTVNGQTFGWDEFKVEGVKPWSPEEPTLYDLTIGVKLGAWSDSVTRKIGFRTIEFREDGFYLNGKKRQLRGVNVHQDREEKGWAITEKDITEDVELVKAMGADAIRGAHYSHSQFFYEECDRLGIICDVEIPASSYVRTNELYLGRLEKLAKEEIAQCRNHPSVAMWSIYNELYSVWDGHKMGPEDGEKVAKLVQKWVKEVDKYHPTTCAAAYSYRDSINRIADALGFNAYPGWYHEGGDQGRSSADMVMRINDFLKSGNCKTVGIGEYGGGASMWHHENPFVRPEPGDVFHPEEDQVELHRIEYGIIKADPRVWGSFVWVMYDFASDNRNEGDRRGINDKGLVTRDRKTLKDTYHFYQTNWRKEPKLFLSGKRLVKASADKVQVVGFSNVGEVTLSVNGEEIGTKTPDDVKVVVWDGVQLREGVNTIEISAGGLKDACNWIYENKAVENRKLEEK